MLAIKGIHGGNEQAGIQVTMTDSMKKKWAFETVGKRSRGLDSLKSVHLEKTYPCLLKADGPPFPSRGKVLEHNASMSKTDSENPHSWKRPRK